MKIINLFVCLFLEGEKIHGTNKFLCPFFKQQLMTFARENLFVLNIFLYFFSAQGESNGDDKFIFMPFIQGEKNPRDKMISLPFFQATVDALRPRESHYVEFFYISFSAQGERIWQDKFKFMPYFTKKKSRGQINFFALFSSNRR